jgi:FkbH-like protein
LEPGAGLTSVADPVSDTAATIHAANRSATATLIGTQDATVLNAPVRKRLATWLEARRAPVLEAWHRSQFDSDRLSRYQVVNSYENDRDAAFRHFLRPLYDLLVEHIRTGEARYRDVYLDERLRYAPHQAKPAVRAAFFTEVIAADEAALRSECPVELETPLRAVLAQVHASLVVAPKQPVRLLVLGDCLMNEIRVFLPGRCRGRGLEIDFTAQYINAASGGIDAGRILDFLAQHPSDLIALSFLTYEGIPPFMSLLQHAESASMDEIEQRVIGIVGAIRACLSTIREQSEIPLLLHNASGLPLTRFRRRLPGVPALSSGRQRALRVLNEHLRELADSIPNVILIDEAAIAERQGHRECSRDVIPPRIARAAHFHTSRFGEHLADDYASILHAYRDLHKTKVLLVDFDNTLWSGVMADGDVHHHADRQALLQRLREAGILLVAVSKNDPANVRWNEMVLKQDDFVLLKISWGAKAQAIEEAAQELDLGLDSFVLIDDNPAEREMVRQHLPMVRALDPDTMDTWKALALMLQFPNTRQTAEARARTELYRQQAQRREAMSSSYNYPAVMASLGLRLEFGKAAPNDLDRLTELVQRTNQFNTTTIRYTRKQLAELISETSGRHATYTASLADKFGELGTVAVAIVERQGERCVIDSFVMSCRAMGFELERAMMRLVIDAEANSGAKTFFGKFVPTSRNAPSAGLFSSTGFRAVSEGEWVLDDNETRPTIPEWFALHLR